MGHDRNSVVPKIYALDEDEFHAAFMVLLSRLIKEHGAAKVAQALGYQSKRQLGNLANGSLPGLRAYYNLLALDQTAHDELDGEYQQRKVPKDAICGTDPLTISIITLASQVAEAESPDSPGGTDVIDHEILKMDETLLRKVHRVTGTWLTRLADIRKPNLRTAA